MSLVIGSLWPLRIPALLLLMCAGTERASERGREGEREGRRHTSPSISPPSIHPSILWLILAANAAPKPLLCSLQRRPKYQLRLFYLFFCFVFPPPPFLQPHPSPLVILEYQQNRSAPVCSLAQSLSSTHISAMPSPPHALCKVCASQQAICMISSFWAGRRRQRWWRGLVIQRAGRQHMMIKKRQQKTKHQRLHVSLYLIHESQTLNTKEPAARRRIITNDI